ncbi:HD family phosphohydrolase [Treponema sp. C6A8]|uniref:HD family phosphohydrolase n=1 Tax=Treponema sp. C6A8 TaxID=1410609 RepID=UPI00047F4504|nr:HDIG domain-containing metalloprotein [Treponema sp. C6A8]
MKNNTKKNNPGVFGLYFQSMGAYISKNYLYLILFFVGLLMVSALNFVKISTVQTIADFSLSDYEINQISDRTIIAKKDLPPDELDPVSIEKGEKIIKKGFPITEEGYAKLKKMSASPLYIDYRAFANAELFLLLLAIMWYLLYCFVPFNRKIYVREPLLQMIFFVLLYVVVSFCGKMSIFSDSYSICIIIPASLFVMLVTILYGNVAAVLLSFVLSLGVLISSDCQVQTFVYTLATSLTSAAIVRKIDRRLDLVFASITLAIFNCVFMVIIHVIFNETFTELPELLGGVAANGFLSGILTLGLLTPLEIMLNTASVFRLMELSDLNHPLMRKMLVQASGTYQHSLMVAQLSENACREIKANALLARVGAYYHDIGKIEQSEYFVENQKGENKHDDLNPSLSRSIIKSHVRKGVEKAHQLHLPQAVIDIIAEHHGNSLIAYFYNEAKELDDTLSPEEFSYSGNPPTTRESAVVMLADTVEAACRTLKSPSVPRLEAFVTQLINGKIEHKQLDNCPLTFRDVKRIKEAFVQILAGYYHSRIEYPDQNEEGKDKTEKNETAEKPLSAAEKAANARAAALAKKEKEGAKAAKEEAPKTEKTEKAEK